jgi:hypothetical protein
MNNKNEDQLPRWINTLQRSLSPYPQTMSACECGDGRFACGGGMCSRCAYEKIAGACGVNITDAYFRALESLRNAQVKYDEYQSKQTKS